MTDLFFVPLKCLHCLFKQSCITKQSLWRFFPSGPFKEVLALMYILSLCMFSFSLSRRRKTRECRLAASRTTRSMRRGRPAARISCCCYDRREKRRQCETLLTRYERAGEKAWRVCRIAFWFIVPPTAVSVLSMILLLLEKTVGDALCVCAGKAPLDVQTQMKR
jgi:hypothetical protein